MYVNYKGVRYTVLVKIVDEVNHTFLNEMKLNVFMLLPKKFSYLSVTIPDRFTIPTMSLSKLFVEKITNKRLLCSDILHPGESCWEFNSYIIRKTWIHCAKFYAPIVLVIKSLM